MRSPSDRGRFAELEPLGVIDIGSNSVRLVVYEGAVRAPTPLFNEKVQCELGRSVASTGRLGEPAVERTLVALQRFGAIARVLKVKNLMAIATAAVREAADGRDFIARAERTLSVKIQILSGEEEARLAAQGIAMGFGVVDGVAGDLGGGSLELIDMQGPTLKNAITLPLGGLRLIDTTGARIERALDVTERELDKVAWIGDGRGRPFYAVGGAWRALARLHMGLKDYPLRVMHAYTMGATEAIQFCEDVRRKKFANHPELLRLSRLRREGLPYGALVMERLLRRASTSHLTVSVFGIREGLLFGLLSEHERAKDPLISFCEDYARLRARSFENAVELCAWTDGLFTEPGPKETPDEKRLRHAACLLSDIGWRAHPDYRGTQSLNVISHAALCGVDHPGRIFLALAVYYRHEGDDEPATDDMSDRLRQFVDKRAVKRARIIGAAVRTAHVLSIGMAGIIDETKLIYDRQKLILLLPKAHAAMAGERLSRRFAILSKLLEKEPVIIVE